MRQSMSVIAVLLVVSFGIVLAADPIVDANLAALEKLDAASTPVTVKSPKARLDGILELLSTTGAFEVEIRSTGGGVTAAAAEAAKTFAVDWDRVSMKDALMRLADELSLRYEVPNPRKLVVHLPEN